MNIIFKFEDRPITHTHKTKLVLFSLISEVARCPRLTRTVLVFHPLLSSQIRARETLKSLCSGNNKSKNLGLGERKNGKNLIRSELLKQFLLKLLFNSKLFVLDFILCPRLSAFLNSIVFDFKSKRMAALLISNKIKYTMVLCNHKFH